MTLGIIFTLIVALGAGTSLVAQSTLSGDSRGALEGKVHQEFRTGLTASTDTKADVESIGAEARTAEAGKLSVKDEADAETKTEIKSGGEVVDVSGRAEIDLGF